MLTSTISKVNDNKFKPSIRCMNENHLPLLLKSTYNKELTTSLVKPCQQYLESDVMLEDLTRFICTHYIIQMTLSYYHTTF